MKKEELKEGLKKLEAYAKELGFETVFLEESPNIAMDSLVFGLQMEEDLSLDVSCNFVHAPDFGDVLQFYGQLELDGLMEEEPEAFTEGAFLELANRLNRLIPIGQFLYLKEGGDGQHALGIRYTTLTELDSEQELEKCIRVVRMLMDIYELLCSTLLLMADGEPVEQVVNTIEGLMGQ